MKYSKELITDIIKYIESGASNKDAAALSGVSEETFYNWLRPTIKKDDKEIPNPDYHPEFSESLKKAKTKRKVAMVNRILSAAKGSWQAAAWYLERQYNEEFGRRDKHELSFDPRKAIKKMDERIKKRWPELEDTTNS
jgi:transposase